MGIGTTFSGKGRRDGGGRLAGAAVAALVAVAATGAAQAGGPDDPAAESLPWLSIEVPVRIGTDRVFSSDDPTARLTDTRAKIEPVITLHLDDDLAIEAGLKLEPVFDPVDSRFFGDHGLFVATLQAVYEADGLYFAAGKLTPEFGVGWERLPGPYGRELAEHYELAERIGLTVAGTADLGDMGEHRLSASAFFLDTTALSRSAFTDRGRTRLADGGPSNTQDLSSFVVSLTGENILATGGLGYHLGFARQDSALAGETAERGLVAALFYEGEIAPGVSLAPTAECAWFDNHAAVPGAKATVCSGGLELSLDGWFVSAVAGAARIAEPGLPVERTRLLQLSAGHEFDNGVAVEAGWRRLNESGVVSHTVGLFVHYTFTHTLARAD